MAPVSASTPMAIWSRRLGWLLPLLISVGLVSVWVAQVVVPSGVGSSPPLASALLAADRPLRLAAQVLPVLLATLVALGLRWLPPRPWSRLLLLVLFGVIGLRFLVWRVTLLPLFSSPAEGLLGGLVLLVEALLLLSVVLPMLPGARYDPNRRSRQADQLVATAAAAGLSVDVWVQARDESTRLVRRALLAARNLGSSVASLRLLDPEARADLAELAASLGVGYCPGRPGESRSALLDRVLEGCSADLIASFDGDMVPLADVLIRTRGFFADDRVAMVQTPPDHFQHEVYNRNLGVDVVMPHDREFFFRYLEVVRDDWNAVLGCGQAWLMRRQAIDAIGGFQAASLASASALAALPQGRSLAERAARSRSAALELGVDGRGSSARLVAAGWRVVYLAETLTLSQGPRRFANYLKHRLQAMAAELAALAAPVAPPRPGWAALLLGLHQALSLWQPIGRLVLLVLPLLALSLGIPLIPAPLPALLTYALPFLILLHTVPVWYTAGHQGQFWNGVTESLIAGPWLRSLLGGLKEWERPTQRPDDVGPELSGSTRPRQSLSLSQAWLFLVLELALLVVLLGRYGLPMLLAIVPGASPDLYPGFIGEGALLIWNLYNGLLVLICLLCCVDQPVLRQGDRVPVRCPVRLRLAGEEGSGVCRDLSETGASVSLASAVDCSTGVEGELWLEGPQPLMLPVSVVRCGQQAGRLLLGLRFVALSPDQEARLLALLYAGGLGVAPAPAVNPLQAVWALLQGLRRANPILR